MSSNLADMKKRLAEIILEKSFRYSDSPPFTPAGAFTLGADPIANALSLTSYQRGKPIKSFTIRKDIKDHGTKSAVEGDVAPGERGVIIDDVITTGGSTITAIERALAAGLVVGRVIA